MTIERYRDPSLTVDDRVDDLLGRMSLPEKAGLLFHTMVTMGPDGHLAGAVPEFTIPSTDELVRDRHLNHFNLLGAGGEPRLIARWHNRLQELARATRLGIPVTLSTDPRHHFTDNAGTGFLAGAFSQWPEPLGLAALRSAALVHEFADIARQEYTAVGLRVALHPQVDLATEPRWCRVAATFGEDADLTCALAAAYITGFQGATFGPSSVSTMTKHFPGGGPQKDGEDPHFAYGREQVYPGGNFDYHLAPFTAALAAGTRQIMPYYGMPVGTQFEEAGFGFNRGVITDLLRAELGFDGIVCTDWGLVTDSNIRGQDMPARAWGAEHLSELERVVKILDAGCDQFGGEARPELVIEAVQAGHVSMDRIDTSVRRLLREKFALGLFDDPFVDEGRACEIVGAPAFVDRGLDAQARSITVLTNTAAPAPDKAPARRTLPLERGVRLYVEGIPADALAGYATVVTAVEDADAALLRLKAPYEPRSGGFEAMFHAGSLAYAPEEQTRQAAIYRAVPTVVDVYLDRAAVIPEIVEQAAAVVVNYGSSAAALLRVLFGEVAPEGRLPFDLPSSLHAVEQSRSDVPFDTADPLFRFGHGLTL